jgi:hypothetical protein
MLGSGGLGPTALGARVRLSGGQLKVIDGPFTEAKEVVGGYAQFELKSKKEAIESAVRFMELHKKYWPGWEGETEVRHQAAIAACHARALTPEETDWARIVALYEALAELAPSPVVELNRAVAVGMAFGPMAGLELVDGLTAEPSLRGYHLLPSVRGDLLRKLGRFDEARAEFERAGSLTRNARERELLRERARACVAGPMPPEPR